MSGPTRKSWLARLKRAAIGLALATGLPVAAGAEYPAPGSFNLDATPYSNQIPCAPEDGAIVAVNPPPLIWVPAGKNLTYVLEVSQSHSFTRQVLHIEDIPISTYALRKPLLQGVHYWRYGIRTGPERKDVIFSRVRSFRVTRDAQEMPFPDLNALAANLGPARPRLLLTAASLETFRQRAAEGDLKEFRTALEARCAARIGEALIPEPPYVTGEGAEWGKNAAHVIETTRPPMDAMEDCALAYALTGNTEFGLEAKRRLLHFFGWNPEGSTAYRHYDEPAMWMMMRGVRAYDWAYDLCTPDERATIERVMRIRAGQFYTHLKDVRRFHSDPFESHAGRTLGFLGEAALAFLPEWPEAREWLDYVLTLYYNVYPAWGREDGGWHEGPMYWTAYMSFVQHFIVAMRETAGIDLMRKPFFQHTPYYALYTNPPYAKISPFGDGEERGANKGTGAVMYAFSTLLHDPYLRWYAQETGVQTANGILGVLLKDDTLSPTPPLDLPQARCFPGVGLASLHTALGNAQEDIHFLIHSDPYGPISHAHADQNAFTIEAFGEPLAIASGYYPWYASAHHTKWQWESKSSNTITYNGGVGQMVRDSSAPGRLAAFVNGSQYDYICADASRCYGGKIDGFLRHVVHIRPGIFLLVDELHAPEPVQFEWRLHAESEMKLDEPARQVIVAQGDARLRVQFLAPAELTFAQDDQFTAPPETGGANQWHFTATGKEPVVSARYVTVLMPYHPGNEAKLPVAMYSESEHAAGVELTMPDGGKHIVVFSTDEGAEGFTHGAFSTQAKAFALHITQSGVLDAAWVAGNGQVTLTRPEGTVLIRGNGSAAEITSPS